MAEEYKDKNQNTDDGRYGWNAQPREVESVPAEIWKQALSIIDCG